LERIEERKLANKVMIKSKPRGRDQQPGGMLG